MAFEHAIETIVSGILTGGATAATTSIGFFRDIKRRITELEAKVGASDSHVGLIFQVNQIKAEMTEWKNYFMQNVTIGLPPMRAQMPTPRQSFLALSAAGVTIDPEDQEERMTRLEKSVKALSSKLLDLEEKLSSVERGVSSSDNKRSEDLQRIREELAGVNGLMRGLAAAMGLYNERGK